MDFPLGITERKQISNWKSILVLFAIYAVASLEKNDRSIALHSACSTAGRQIKLVWSCSNANSVCLHANITTASVQWKPTNAKTLIKQLTQGWKYSKQIP